MGSSLYPSVVRVLATDEYAAWFAGLDDRDARAVAVAVLKLEALGLALPYPHSSNVEGARYGIRELRPKSGASPLRVFYAFDPRRDTVLLIGGDKAQDKRLYDRVLAVAEAIFERHLAELDEGEG